MRLGTVVAVLFILWLALKSPKIILADDRDHADRPGDHGALGLWMIGAFNPISIAFAVLFVGIGVDFGIQFSVRYRAERYEVDDLQARWRTRPGTSAFPHLAAAATAAGFFSFLPTAYGGFSELGAIAGVGMIVAYVVSITLLPALLEVLNPPGEKEPLGFQGSLRSTISRSAIAFLSSSARWASPSPGCRCCTSCNSTSIR